MYRLTLNAESHMEESLYSLNSTTSIITREEKVKTAKSVLLFLFYINKPHISAYLSEEQITEIEKWSMEEDEWIFSSWIQWLHVMYILNNSKTLNSLGWTRKIAYFCGGNFCTLWMCRNLWKPRWIKGFWVPPKIMSSKSDVQISCQTQFHFSQKLLKKTKSTEINNNGRFSDYNLILISSTLIV